ncbi:tyrosine--tRNA ligase [Candidatus Woesearchaeota archaeon]|jgi:tyrosyl-tRNA synthetase|nr:tyrosine--tRNA ligase [Candidatus Woesearchaeota archaeon]MBT4835383.1 tyrosine--tRNA ligase [Candidatus Woesearchaeota archaeon]MBT6735021.1 tyrosine--tRNA ligase [Candidatus Woesearchaeota archaeon]MBT7169880.1 tyrosine--tRNA ligase [Candidatus Woesearchaeota archaeon]MBT7474882.1 tyrosine--tRNA ligase [Candidatus Woesearchaeota archaeon]
MDRLELIKRNNAEIINEEEIPKLLEKKKPIVYCGYETSGEIHLGHLVTITKLIDLAKAGFHVKVLFADWHTFLNQKGDWDFIEKQVKNWTAGFKAAGLEDVEFVLGSSFQRKIEYIDDVFTIATRTTINRSLRSMQQVARDIEHAKVSQVIYPFMQIVDIKHLDVDLVQSGIEQRKIHMLGTETLGDIDFKSPVFIHTPLISSLGGAGKMSSSDEGSFISIRDSDESITKKIKKAHCVAGEVKDNPILQITQLIVFPRVEKFVIDRPEKFGGNLEFGNYEQLEKAFVGNDVHPLDLKNALSKYLIEIITPIRAKFK